MGRKVKITLPKIEDAEVAIGDKKVKINGYINLKQYDTILDDIKSVILYNKEIEDKYELLHVRIIKDVLELCTNIDTSNLEGEDLNSPYLKDILVENIINFKDIECYIEKEYEKWVMENCFGILAHNLPSSDDMEKSMKKLSETIENLPEDKLELISKSIVWNNIPTLGQQVAPALHVVKESD